MLIAGVGLSQALSIGLPKLKRPAATANRSGPWPTRVWLADGIEIPSMSEPVNHLSQSKPAFSRTAPPTDQELADPKIIAWLFHDKDFLGLKPELVLVGENRLVFKFGVLGHWKLNECEGYWYPVCIPYEIAAPT